MAFSISFSPPRRARAILREQNQQPQLNAAPVQKPFVAAPPPSTFKLATAAAPPVIARSTSDIAQENQSFTVNRPPAPSAPSAAATLAAQFDNDDGDDEFAVFAAATAALANGKTVGNNDAPVSTAWQSAPVDVSTVGNSTVGAVSLSPADASSATATLTAQPTAQQTQSDSTQEQQAFVNARLQALGLLPTGVALSMPTNTNDAAVITSCLYQLLVDRARLALVQQQQSEQCMRLASENEQLDSRVQRTLEAVKAAERETALWQEKWRAQKSEFNQQQRAWEKERADLAKEITILQHRDNQYQHEIRKREKDVEKSKVQLSKALADKSKDTRGLDLHTPLGAKPLAQGNANAELHARIMKDLQERQRAVQHENEALRARYAELASCVQQLHAQVQSIMPRADAANQEEWEDVYPQNLSPEEVVSWMQQAVGSVCARAATLAPPPEDADAAELRRHIEHARKLISQQDKLLRYSVAVPAANGQAFVTPPDSPR